jgi:hypothetical protein
MEDRSLEADSRLESDFGRGVLDAIGERLGPGVRTGVRRIRPRCEDIGLVGRKKGKRREGEGRERKRERKGFAPRGSNRPRRLRDHGRVGVPDVAYRGEGGSYG